MRPVSWIDPGQWFGLLHLSKNSTLGAQPTFLRNFQCPPSPLNPWTYKSNQTLLIFLTLTNAVRCIDTSNLVSVRCSEFSVQDSGGWSLLLTVFRHSGFSKCVSNDLSRPFSMRIHFCSGYDMNCKRMDRCNHVSCYCFSWTLNTEHRTLRSEHWTLKLNSELWTLKTPADCLFPIEIVWIPLVKEKALNYHFRLDNMSSGLIFCPLL